MKRPRERGPRAEMKQRGIVFVGLGFLILYFFLFPRSTGTELVFVPLSVRPLVAVDPFDSPPGPLQPFRLAEFAGFFLPGPVPHYVMKNPGAAVSADWIVPYDPESPFREIRGTDGRLRARIISTGIPVSRGERLFLYHAITGNLEERDGENGTLLWSRDFVSPLTVIDATKDRTLVGLLDGRVLVFDRGGNLLLDFRPGGSRIEAVYGGGLSPDGRRIALICGADPQRFILLEERKNGYRPESHFDLVSDFRGFVPLSFDGPGSRVFFESEVGLGAYNPDTGTLSTLEQPGRVLAWENDTQNGGIAVLAANGEAVRIRSYAEHNALLFDFVVDREVRSLNLWNDLIMWANEDRLVVLERRQG